MPEAAETSGSHDPAVCFPADEPLRAAQRELAATDDAPVLPRPGEFPADFHHDEDFDLDSHAVDSLARAVATRSTLGAGRESRDDAELIECIRRLASMPAEPAAILKHVLQPADFIRAVCTIARVAVSEPSAVEYCGRLLAGSDTDEVLQVCEALGRDAVASVAEAVRSLPRRLQDAVDELDGSSALEVRRRVPLLRALPTLLGDHAKLVSAWERFLAAAEDYRHAQSERWNRRGELLWSRRSELLEERAWRLARTALDVIPNNSDRWDRLVELLGEPLRRDRRPFRQAARKIEEFLRTGVWPRAPLTVVARHHVSRAAAWIAGTVAALLAGLIAYSLLVGIGGLTGIVMFVFLAGLWAIFCATLSRVM